jgi:non-ribosomal peptide synthetase component F
MVIAPSTIYGGDELVEFLAEQAVTHAFITPAALAAARAHPLPDLRTLGVGGEASTPELLARWAPGRRYINCYGPTETTIVATMSQPLAAGDAITIGSPVDGCGVHVLDRHLRPVPDHVPGDLYLSGPGVARGYLNRRGLTATRFVADPEVPGAVMYRTGDIVHRAFDGSLIYHGRSDNQVKVRGFRIELDEVSAALSAVDGVDFATTVVRGRGAGRAHDPIRRPRPAPAPHGARRRGHPGPDSVDR